MKKYILKIWYSVTKILFFHNCYPSKDLWFSKEQTLLSIYLLEELLSVQHMRRKVTLDSIKLKKGHGSLMLQEVGKPIYNKKSCQKIWQIQNLIHAKIWKTLDSQKLFHAKSWNSSLAKSKPLKVYSKVFLVFLFEFHIKC